MKSEIITYKNAKNIYNYLNNKNNTTYLFDFLQNLILLTEQFLLTGEDNAFRYQPIFEQCLSHKKASIKQCGIEGLLFTMHLNDNKYIEKAFDFLYTRIPINKYGFWDDYEIDSDLKLISASSLGQAFIGTKDKIIIKGLLYAIEVNGENNGLYDSDSIRICCFKSILSIYYGYNSNKLKNIDLEMKYEDINFEEYKFNEIINYSGYKK